jgi:hypothetical protein
VLGAVWFFVLGCFPVCVGMGGVAFLTVGYVVWGGMRMGDMLVELSKLVLFVIGSGFYFSF